MVILVADTIWVSGLYVYLCWCMSGVTLLIGFKDAQLFMYSLCNAESTLSNAVSTELDLQL